MKVSLISVTPDALTLLLQTKSTRLMHADDPATWSAEKRAEHLAYMRDTIKSSWEFVDYVFKVEGVTRVFTHQFVRTRNASYAQETQRATDSREADCAVPPSLYAHELTPVWDSAIEHSFSAYERMVDGGIAPQDARGLLPQNTKTSIIAKFNLRTLHEMAKLRLCTRTQGEYQDVFREMRRLIIETHPWTGDFLDVHCVATGTCAFPRYGMKECPVYFPELDNTTVREEAHKRFWAIRYEATPRAKEGKSM